MIIKVKGFKRKRRFSNLLIKKNIVEREVKALLKMKLLAVS
jgi:hypothetical protein